MDTVVLEGIINSCLDTGCDFAEVFYEETIKRNYNLVDSKIKTLSLVPIKGIGIRLALGNEVVYGSTNKIDQDSINELINTLKNKFNDNVKIANVVLHEEVVSNINPIKKNLSNEEKVAFLKNIDSVARKFDLINQVEAMLIEENRNITIANSLGKLINSSNNHLRLYTTIYAERDEEKASSTLSIGGSVGYELFDNIDIDKRVQETAKNAISKLDAKYFKGGELPVIIGPGFGAVIFHEACGHGLEATAVSVHESVFSDKFGERIASDKVTLIDDGTIANLWGSNTIDDEGNLTNRNVLIKNGILNCYLVDYLNNRKMNKTVNGCSRRQDYTYMPTSRMSNTYLEPGTDKIEDMIKSIDYGVYCKDMGGGSVNPITGDFNFAVNDAYLIENGEITDQIKGISLIGNSRDILMNVEAVSDDLDFGCGICGSLSGGVPVTIGQPTIKVSKILVGGRE